MTPSSPPCHAHVSDDNDFDGVGKTSKCFGLDSGLSTQDMFKVRVGMWNLETLTDQGSGILQKF